MKITILGCGSAGGVPLIGNIWGACNPSNPRNRRTRPSVLVEEGDEDILVDTSPDLRQQMLDHHVERITAVLYTHAHADHCHGIDDLRSVNWLMGKKIPVYADKETMNELMERFRYIFDVSEKPNVFTRPGLETHILDGSFSLGSVQITAFKQSHGNNHSLGFRFNDFAYTTDVSDLDEDSLSLLEGVKVWVTGCVRERPHPSHAHLEKILEWVHRLRPGRTYLTHMDQSMDYAALIAKLPETVAPAYDGLVIEC